MKRALLDPEKCRNCSVCNIEANCDSKAIIRERMVDKPWVDFEKCRGCMKCKQYCNNGAVEEILQTCNLSNRRTW